ncbi:transketolase [Agrobacterium sp. NPDC090283]|uniref:transketolase n=1 Tax=Agrobacterium sp. NPDC090283 TaxID=3363920 RepID=UPI00383BC4B0
MRKFLDTSFNAEIDLDQRAKRVRMIVLAMIRYAKEGHIGAALSIADILAVLYFCVLRVDPERPNWDDRDRFILSKGHGCGALYAVLAEKGYFPHTDLATFLAFQTKFAGHPDMHAVEGVDFSTGSLGNGFPVAVGMALGLRDRGSPARVFALLGDGELNEGVVWEALAFAAHRRLNNLCIVVDRNNLQIAGVAEKILKLEPLADKIRSFGWSVVEADGHNVSDLSESLSQVGQDRSRPYAVIARTIKGKGVSFMENDTAWHYKAPSDNEFQAAFEELEAHRQG